LFRGAPRDAAAHDDTSGISPEKGARTTPPGMYDIPFGLTSTWEPMWEGKPIVPMRLGRTSRIVWPWALNGAVCRQVNLMMGFCFCLSDWGPLAHLRHAAGKREASRESFGRGSPRRCAGYAQGRFHRGGLMKDARGFLNGTASTLRGRENPLQGWSAVAMEPAPPGPRPKRVRRSCSPLSPRCRRRGLEGGDPKDGSLRAATSERYP